jgi:AcrR family transcriptional regulator
MMSEQQRTVREIRKAAKRRAKADADRRQATEDLRTYCEAARFAGVSITQIASEAGLSRQGVYDLLGERPSS